MSGDEGKLREAWVDINFVLPDKAAAERDVAIMNYYRDALGADPEITTNPLALTSLWNAAWFAGYRAAVLHHLEQWGEKEDASSKQEDASSELKKKLERAEAKLQALENIMNTGLTLRENDEVITTATLWDDLREVLWGFRPFGTARKKED